MTCGRWNGKEIDPFEISITKRRHPSGEIKLIETILIYNPSFQICRSSNSQVSFVVMGSSAGTTAKEEDQHIYILVPGVTREDLVRSGGKMSINLNEEDIALIYAKNQIHAIQAKCPHAGGPLHQGDIEDLPGNITCIKCPWHSWQFNLKTGECKFPGNRPNQKLQVYPVKVTDNQIRIGFDQIAPKYFKTPPS